MPIVVLTAEGSDARKVEALYSGADDYVTKPFSMPELLDRIRVAIRHHRARRTNNRTRTRPRCVGDIRIDLLATAVTVGGRPVDLTPKEFGFLSALARQPGRVITHRAILEEVWGLGVADTQYLRVYAGQIRKKLVEDPTRPRHGSLEPGVGHRAGGPERDFCMTKP